MLSPEPFISLTISITTGLFDIFMIDKQIVHRLSQMLCPPGEGVFTVNTAKSRKVALQKHLYAGVENIRNAWKASLTQVGDKNTPLLLGVCSDTGGGILRGANWGPLFVREALMKAYPSLHYLDVGDVRVIPHFHHDKYLNKQTISLCRDALYGDNNGNNLPVSALSITEEVLTDIYANCSDQRVFAIGGDHSVSYPLTKTYLKAKKKSGTKVAIIHFDAHTDLLESRLGVDICFGSWCTHILKYLPDPSCLIQLGIRSSNKNKKHWESVYGIQQYWANEISEQGAEGVANRIVEFIERNNIEELYISFDIDALDDSVASATGTPEPNGLMPVDALNIITTLSGSVPITGGDLAEVAPFVKTEKDIDGKGIEKTLSVSAEIAYKIMTSFAGN